MKLGRFTLGIRLGSGGFGVVYRGTYSRDNKEYAVKVLEAADDEEALKRFRREVRIQSQLKHPNVVKIVDFDLEANPPWFVMPLAKGNLAQHYADLQSEEQQLQAFSEIVSGVQYAHSKSVIHRDLKPQNILVFDDARLAIADFGLGRLMTRDSTTITRTQQPIGTLAYMAPEQFVHAKDADARSDIYSLGKILYEMVTQEVPWPNIEVARLPGKFQYLVNRCVRNDPAERFESARQLVSELELLQRAEEFEEPSEKSTRTVEEVLALKPGRPNDVRRLDELLDRERNNGDLYRMLLPRIPPPLFRAYGQALPRRLIEMVEQYDAYVSGNLDFGYTDLVADLYGLCFEVVEDIRFRKMLLVRLLDMGFRHNRFHVRDIFWSLVAACKEPGLAMTTVEVIRANPPAAEWMAERMSRYSLLPIVEKAFKTIANQKG